MTSKEARDMASTASGSGQGERVPFSKADEALPTVTIELSYDEALRLSYVARFPTDPAPCDSVIADKVDAGITRVEEAERSRD